MTQPAGQIQVSRLFPGKVRPLPGKTRLLPAPDAPNVSAPASRRGDAPRNSMLPSPRTLLPLLLLAGALALPWPGTALAGPGDGPGGDGPEGFGPDGAYEDSGLPDLEAGSPAHAGARGKTLVADDLPLMPPDGSATRTPLVVRRDLAQMDSLEGGLAIAAPPLGFPGPLEAGLAGRAGRPFEVFEPLDGTNLIRRSGLLPGRASWYGKDFHMKPTASGKPYNMYDFTAAHKTLPLGTILRVFDRQTGRSVIVTVNDRGPYIPGRSIDLSYAAADALGMVERGVADVDFEILARNPSAPWVDDPDSPQPKRRTGSGQEAKAGKTLDLAAMQLEAAGDGRKLKADEAYYIALDAPKGWNRLGPYASYKEAKSVRASIAKRHPEAQIAVGKRH